MKKIYKAPVTEVIKVETQQMIAQSQVDMYYTNATSAGMSRGRQWDDEEEDEWEDDNVW